MVQRSAKVGKFTRWMAAVCGICPLCIMNRKGSNNLAVRLYRCFAWLCPFCRAYERKKAMEEHSGLN